MTDALIILQPSVAAADRIAVTRAAPATQSISDRVFLTTIDETMIDQLRAMDGVAIVLTAAASGVSLPDMDEAESLFVAAWLSSRGHTKVRRGEGLDWGSPPMLPPGGKPD